jgi:hypothetical protein
MVSRVISDRPFRAASDCRFAALPLPAQPVGVNFSLRVTPHQVEWSPCRSMATTSVRGTRGMYWVIRFRSVTQPPGARACAEHRSATRNQHANVHVQAGMDEIEPAGIRDEGYDPDDPATRPRCRAGTFRLKLGQSPRAHRTPTSTTGRAETAADARHARGLGEVRRRGAGARGVGRGPAP